MNRLWPLFLFFLISCNSNNDRVVCEPPEADSRTMKYGYAAYITIEDALQCSHKTGKPILIMFTASTSLSVRKLPWLILQDDEIRKLIEERFVFTVLFVDDTTPLADLNNTKRELKEGTIGHKNVAFQAVHFQSNAQPLYSIVDRNLKQLTEPINYTSLKQKLEFIRFLEKGLNKENLTKANIHRKSSAN